MGTYMANISANHNHATIPIITGATAVIEGIHYASHPVTTVVCSVLWPMDAPITTQTMTHPTGIVTPHPKLTTSPTDVSHALFHGSYLVLL